MASAWNQSGILVTSGPATGGTVATNSATGWQLLEGATPYLTADSRTDREQLVVGKRLVQVPLQVVTSGNATFELVLGTAGANEAKLLGNVVGIDGSAGTGMTLTLPSAVTCDGSFLSILNAGSQPVDVLNGFGTTTIPQDGAGHFFAAGAFPAWMPLNTLELRTARIVSGVITVALGANTGTVVLGAAFDGKPAQATCASLDATFVHPISANVAGGTLTVTGLAAATAAVDVYYSVDGR